MVANMDRNIIGEGTGQGIPIVTWGYAELLAA